MRAPVFRPAALLIALVLILSAALQASAASPLGGARATAPNATRSAPLAMDAAARARFEAAAHAVDRSRLRVTTPAAYARLDATLNRLADQHAAGAADRAVAAETTLRHDDAVAVSLHGADATALAGWLTAHGAQVANTGAGVVEAYVPVGQLAALDGAPGLASARAIVPPMAQVTSQGAGVHGSPAWNAAGFTGAGVKVGIIDVGFDGITSLLGSELPATVVARCYNSVGSFSASVSDCQNGEVHGAAVAESLLDIAPGVTLYVADPYSTLDLQATAQWMASQGVTIISHSVGWTWDGPGDGTSAYSDSPLKTVDAAVAAGITWINAAGNNETSTWYGPYVDADHDGLAEFSRGYNINAFPVLGGVTVTLEVRWDDSWFAAHDDLNVAVINENGDPVALANEPQNGTPGQTPFEILQFTPPADGAYYFGIGLVGGAKPDWMQVQMLSQNPLYFASVGHSITNPAESANSGLLAVGAADWQTPDTIEDFSSEGPTPDGRVKPDIVGADAADTVTYGANGFPGTSQAAPHVAGLAALVKQRFPDYSPAQVADYLKSNAIARGDGHPNNVWGYGFAHLPDVGDTGPGPDPDPDPDPDPTPTPGAGDAAFDIVWGTTDQAVANGQGGYSWFWGPQSNDQTYEAYAESPNQQREVRYYDKSRMEINNPSAEQNSIYYVTNGLLTEELVTGRMQTGNGAFENRAPATELVAGDATNNPGTPSYAAFAPYVTTDGQTHRADDRTGQQVTDYLNGAGALSSTDSQSVQNASYQSATGHNIPNVFWNWANSPSSGFRPEQGVDWLYVLGYPISEPFWIDSTVGGTPHRVLVQLFERRVLTYTPTNPAAYQVEFGNIGQHYHRWRYGS